MGRSRIPLYLKFAQILRQEIRSLTYTPGSILPGELILASRYKVSPETVRKALGLLESEGMLVTKRGRGRIIQEIPPLETVALRHGDQVAARLPTEDERTELGIPEGVPVLAVAHADGAEDVYDSNRVRIAERPLPEQRAHS
ncbi:MAG TPA: GntR family transcriptional regulator [Trebonia sp.]